jgi:hypothetical protein
VFCYWRSLTSKRTGPALTDAETSGLQSIWTANDKTRFENRHRREQILNSPQNTIHSCDAGYFMGPSVKSSYLRTTLLIVYSL